MTIDELRDFDFCFNLAKEISVSNDSKKLIDVIENWEYVHPEVRSVFLSLIEGFGFYPYLNDGVELDLATLIRREYHKSQFVNKQGNRIVFHYEQKILEEKINKKQNLVISAPTSFGKSLLIEEFVARRKYENILIIQPTLALIDETRRKLSHYSDYYNIVVNTHQEIGEKNLFILTSERVLDILPNIDGIDLFIIDEFYKIANSKKDDRVSHLNIAFYKIMKFKPQLLFLTPIVDNISEDFIRKYDIQFYRTNYSLVNQKAKQLSYESEDEKEEKLFQLLDDLSEPTIVYVRSPKRSENLAKKYIEQFSLEEKKKFPVFEWIDENISSDWILKKFLENGVGLHNGQYPRHIVNSQLDYFNSGDLKVIFATTSLIEGVNSIAKNVIIYDMFKGTRKITYFDFNNIKGRAGRMMKYYTGNIFYFDNPPERKDEFIDIPVVDQEHNLQSEILLNIDKSDLKQSKQKDVQKLVEGIPNDLIEIFKNNYYDVEKQKSLFNYIISNRELLKILNWHTPMPEYSVLLETLRIIDEGLKGKEGTKYKYTATKCQQIINHNISNAIQTELQYLYRKKGSSHKEREELLNEAISNIFSFIKNQAKYEIPKVLSILQSIVNYIQKSDSADYSLFIAKLEHEGVDENVSVLLDFGVPSSALRKIRIPRDVETIEYVKENLELLSDRLLNYEIAKLSQI
ncbi:helicase-related protein [Streptococcus sp. SS6]|uniref:DEAD/DEAH box helicase n=1 Tax=Streptococcus sp. SS6 TaxID=3018254 RepID=UPI00263E7C55|nr:DEAD/DEAH box helicase [Streptococcus sp. SS6]MDN5036905.1 helicase-related protein [Streptococcus sp. SS6]